MHVQVWGDVMYSVLVASVYPQRIAFQFLSDLRLAIEEQFGDELENAARKFALQRVGADPVVLGLCNK